MENKNSLDSTFFKLAFGIVVLSSVIYLFNQGIAFGNWLHGVLN